MKLSTMFALLLVLSLFAAACGTDESDDAASVAADADAMADEAMADADAMAEDAVDDMEGAMDDMSDDLDDHGGMSMGDPDATPADEIEGADLVQGSFTLLETAPDGYDNATGTAYMARTDDGVTVTLRVEGLPADTEFVSHVHEQACSEDNGGPHFKFEADGSDVPPNEIHLNFTTDADGSAVMHATNDQVPGDDATALVIHPSDFPDNRTLCADFA